MHRTIGDANVGNLFDEGDPGVPRQPTQIDAKSLNAIQENICQAIEACDILLGDGTEDVTVAPASEQLLHAIRMRGYPGPHCAIAHPADMYSTGASGNVIDTLLNAGCIAYNTTTLDREMCIQAPGATVEGVWARIPLPRGSVLSAIEILCSNHAATDQTFTSVAAWLHDLPVVGPSSVLGQSALTRTMVSDPGVTTITIAGSTTTAVWKTIVLDSPPPGACGEGAYLTVVFFVPAQVAAATSVKVFQVRASFEPEY